MRTTKYTIGASGTFTDIFATLICRRVEIIEDFSANGGVGQGLNYKFADGQQIPFTVVYSVAPATEPIILGNVVSQGKGYGPVIGIPAQQSGGYSTPATRLISISSASATPTAIRVTEFD